VNTRIAWLGSVLVTLVCGAALALLQQSTAALEQEMLRADDALARVLGGLRRRGGELECNAIRAFVEHSDRPDVSLGLVYALEIGSDGIINGEINPRLFASLGPGFKRLMLEGREDVLRRLAGGKVDRSDRIRELGVGRLRLGFDLARIDRVVQETSQLGLLLLAALWIGGVLLALLVSRMITRPLGRLVQQTTAVAGGEVHQALDSTARGDVGRLARAFDQLRQNVASQVDAREQLRPYLGQMVVERILSEPNPLEIAAEERAVTVMVVGFRGLSSLGQSMGSTDALRMANEYLAPVIDAIVDRGGMVSHLALGRLVAVWGFPQPVKEPERSAIKAALAVQAGVRQEGRRQAAIGGLVLDPCIGISSGRSTGGNLGSLRRVVYTVTGGAVEVGCLIERQCQPGEILVNEAAFDKVRGVVNGRPCAPLMIEEMEEAVPLYRLE